MSHNRLLSISLFLSAFYLGMVSCQNNQNGTEKIVESKTQADQNELIVELYNTKQYQKFIQLAENEENSSGNDHGYYLALSDAYGNIGNFDKAFYYVRKLLEKEPSNYYALLAIGNYNFVLEKLDSAEYFYKKVLEIRPTYARANLNLAKVYEKQNKSDEAIDQYFRAIELFKKNDFQEEVALYSERILELDPNNKEAKENIANQSINSNMLIIKE